MIGILVFVTIPIVIVMAFVVFSSVILFVEFIYDERASTYS